MFTPDAFTLNALLSGAAEMTFRVTVVTPTLVTDIDVVDDQVGVNSSIGQQVTRTAALTVTTDLIASGLLNPISDSVFIRCSVRGLMEIPLFYGRVSQLTDAENGHVAVTCVGQLNDVIKDQFAQPWTSSSSRTATREFAAIVQDVDSSFAVTIDPSVNDAFPPAQSWEGERGQALDALVNQISCNYQDQRAGGMIVYPNPFGLPDPPQTGITLSDGVNGTLVTVSRATSRETIYNSVTVISQPMSDGNGNQPVPLRVTVVDNDPLSPTQYGGPFGKRNITYTTQTFLDNGALSLLALQLLRQSLALTETWTITTPFMPILDPDDVFAVHYRGVTSTVVAATIQHNGTAGTSTSITASKLQLLSAFNAVS